MCLGVYSLHSEGILHRDLKSLNVFLTADGTAKIGDLGSAVKVGENLEKKEMSMNIKKRENKQL